MHDASIQREVTVPDHPILARPATLSLTWSEQARRTLPYFELVARRWDAWVATNTPTDGQVYRNRIPRVLGRAFLPDFCCARFRRASSRARTLPLHRAKDHMQALGFSSEDRAPSGSNQAD